LADRFRKVGILFPPALLIAGFALAASDTAEFQVYPGGQMSALLEKTLFKVDVVELKVRVDEATAGKLVKVVEGQSKYTEELANRVATEVLAAPNAWIRMEFLRSIKLSQFLDSIEKSMEHVLQAGWISEDHFNESVAQLPEWYAFLEERGIKDGDTMQYFIHEDMTRYLYTGVEGDVLLDTSEVDTRSRYSVLGSYFAPKSDFRKGLVRSLLP